LHGFNFSAFHIAISNSQFYFRLSSNLQPFQVSGRWATSECPV
jgi:hypothetical protein